MSDDRTPDEIRAALLKGGKAAGSQFVHVSGTDVVVALTGVKPDHDKPASEEGPGA